MDIIIPVACANTLVYRAIAIAKEKRMSSNKLGGVPSKTRDALYEVIEGARLGDDALWAKALLRLKELGPEKALKRMRAD